MKAFLSVVAISLLSHAAYAWQRYTDSVTSGLFLQGSGYTIPDKYFQNDPINSDSYILTRCPYGASTCGDPVNAGPMNWTLSNLNYASYPSKYDELSSGFPGFSEYLTDKYGRPVRGQCVAFAKVATNTKTTGTGSWFANGSVKSSGVYLTVDNSYQQRGNMIAYFPSGNGSHYPDGLSSSIWTCWCFSKIPVPITPL